jgi:hypothetical protein
VVPSADWNPVIVVPMRTSFTQYGAAAAAPTTLIAAAPALVRDWKRNPLAADTSMNAYDDPAVSQLRIITRLLSTGSRFRRY